MCIRDRIKLNYLQNVFSIGFSTDNFLHIGGGEVEYRLIGSNDEWSENRLGNDITYTNISPGDYVFEIRLKNFPEVIRSLPVSYTHLDVYKRQLGEWILYASEKTVTCFVNHTRTVILIR